MNSDFFNSRVSQFVCFFFVLNISIKYLFFTDITSDQCDMRKSLIRVQFIPLFIIATWKHEKILLLEKLVPMREL